MVLNNVLVNKITQNLMFKEEIQKPLDQKCPETLSLALCKLWKCVCGFRRGAGAGSQGQ